MMAELLDIGGRTRHSLIFEVLRCFSQGSFIGLVEGYLLNEGKKKCFGHLHEGKLACLECHFKDINGVDFDEGWIFFCEDFVYLFEDVVHDLAEWGKEYTF